MLYSRLSRWLSEHACGLCTGPKHHQADVHKLSRPMSMASREGAPRQAHLCSLARVKPCIGTWRIDQFRVRARLNNPAVRQHENPVRVSYG